MIKLVALKALAGFNYVRADQVIAIGADRSDQMQRLHGRRRDDSLLAKPAKDVHRQAPGASRRTVAETAGGKPWRCPRTKSKR